MPNAAERNWVIASVLILLVPAVFGLLIYGFLHHSIVTKYDGCIRSLTDDQRRTRGLTMIVEDLRRLGNPEYAWNINAPYRSGSLNILIPTNATEEWHAGCGLPTSPANCMAAARSSFIICNALVGQQLSNPLLVSGIAREEIARARRFLALVILGHEIGHLQAGDTARLQHVLPTRKANGLSCRRRDKDNPTVEEKADQFGVALACNVMRSGDQRAGNDVEFAIRTTSALRNALDDELFAFDDSCAGDDTYPSTSRRKSSFAQAYAHCLYPGPDYPWAAVATEQVEAFRRLEEWLWSHQIDGFAGSPEYGVSPAYRYDVVGTSSRHHFVSFDSSPTTSRVAVTTVGEKEIQHQVVAHWDRSGYMVGSHSDDVAAEFLASFPAADDANITRHVVVTCDGRTRPCKSNVSERRISNGSILWRLNGKGAAMTAGMRLWSYGSYADLVKDKALVTTIVEFDVDEDRGLVAGDADRLLLGRRPDNAEIPSGFHRIAIITKSDSRWLTFTTLPESSSPLQAVGLFGNIAAFVFASDAAAFEARPALWLCPVEPLGHPGSSSVECDVHRAPRDLRFNVGLANNDLQSLGTKVVSFERCENLIGVHHSGWLWLVDPARNLADAVPGSGLIHCAADGSSGFIYRARRIDEVRLSLAPGEMTKASIGIVPTK